MEQDSIGDEITKQLIKPDLDLILQENEAMGFGKVDGRALHCAKEFIRKYGFDDLELRLIRQFAEVGEIQTENDIAPVMEQDRKEDAFRDFLAGCVDLSQIEEGLKFRRAEDVLHSGRQDIVAVDSLGNEVTIELKARDYTRREVMYELDKYRGETNFRSIIVAPKIRPDMVFGLIDHYRAGRIKFVEVDGNHEDYEFREITPENFSEKQRKSAEKELASSKVKAKERTGYSRDTGVLDYSAKRRRNGKTKKIHKDERKVRNETFETALVENSPEIQKDSEDETLEQFIANAPNYPLFYNMMVVYDVGGKDKKKYLKPRQISPEQRKGLEELLSTNEIDFNVRIHKRMSRVHKELVEQGLADADGRYYVHANDCDKEVQKFLEKVNDFEFQMRKGFAEVIELIGHHQQYPKNCNYHIVSDELSSGISLRIFDKGSQNPGKLEETWKSMGLEERLGVLEKWSLQIDKKITELDRGQTPDSKMVADYFKVMDHCTKESPEEERSYSQEALRFRYFRVYNGFLKLKLARTRKLLEIDETLAEAYLTFTPSSEGYLDQIIHEDAAKKSVPFSTDFVIYYVERDRQIYDSILELLVSDKEVDSQIKEKPLYHQLMALHDLALGNRDKYLEPFKVSKSQKQMLDRLVERPGLDKWVELYDEDFDCDPEVRGNIDTSSVFSRVSARDRAVAAKGFSQIEEVFHNVHGLEEIALRYMAGYDERVDIEKLDALRKELMRTVTTLDTGGSPTAKAIKKSTEISLKYVDDMIDQRKAKGLKSMYKFSKAHLVCELLEAKIDRARALEEIDPNIAQAYLRYSITTERELANGRFHCPEMSPEFSLTNERIKQYLEGDKGLYRSILENMTAVEEPLKTQAEIKPKQERVDDRVIEAYNPSQRIKDSVVNGHSDRFKDGYQSWLGYFVSDIAQAGYNEAEIRNFAEALEGVKISRSFRHRGEGPQMHGLETFSQDVKLKYLLERKVPSAEELKKLYAADVGGEQ